LITWVPRTTSFRAARLEVVHQARAFDPGAFDPQSIGTMPSAKLMRRIASLDPITLARVEDSVRSSL
jgi:mRNA-degrading endonuclease toxin of MazEF toxin-antitoxin module